MADDSSSTFRLGHIRGLDGLRALSVVVVLFYHSHLSFMTGGYLGVEIFFVISGFLITSLLLNEADRNGGIDLLHFWERRFLRLLPALLALLLLVTLLGAVLPSGQGAQFRFDIVASLLYFENWYQISSGSSYFADQGLPLLRHIWSLAVEEQFYLLWPLLVAGLLRLARGRRGPLLLATLLLFAASLTTALALALQANPAEAGFLDRLNRIYLGTDTRAFGILLGALLAMTDWHRTLRGWLAALLGATGLISLAGLVALCAILDARELPLYRGGFLLVDLLTLLVIAALVRIDNSALKGLLAWRPLEYLGQRSYGIYLWHWPIFRLLAPGEDSPAWIAARILLALLVADLSFRWLETPIRQGRLTAWFAARDQLTAWLRRAAAVSACATLGVTVGWAGALLAQQPPYVDEIAESLRRNTEALDRTLVHQALHAPAPAAPREQVNPSATRPRLPAALPPPQASLPAGRVEITAVGDSVMKGAAIALKKLARDSGGLARIYVDAEESRSFEQGHAILAELKRTGSLGDLVLIHLGANNSHIDDGQFARLAKLLADRRLVLFMTVKSDKTAPCAKVNATLARLVAATPNARLFDWQGAADGHPELFYSDRTHLRPVGADFYAATVFAQLGQLPPAASPAPSPVADTTAPAEGAAQPSPLSLASAAPLSPGPAPSAVKRP